MALRAVLRQFSDLVSRIADPHSIEIISGIAASAEGYNLMARIGMTERAAALSRNDGHSFMSGSYSVVSERIREMLRG